MDKYDKGVHPRHTQFPPGSSVGSRGNIIMRSSSTHSLPVCERDSACLTCEVFVCVFSVCVFSFLFEIVIIKTGNTHAQHWLRGMSRYSEVLLVAVFAYDTFEVSSRCYARGELVVISATGSRDTAPV